MGSPTAIGRIATLWPAGIRSTVVTPSATNTPTGMLERAISTPSSGCSRITGAGAIGVSLVKSAKLASSEWRVANRNTPTRYSLFAIRSLRLAGGILAGLRHLHPGIGRHQPDLIG